MSLLSRIFAPAFPELDWIQVGITTVCDAACVYCPQAVFRKNWSKKHIDQETFQALVPAFSRASLVYLQGWGEPLTHPDLFQLLKQVKAEGCRAGLTTNGNLLDKKNIARLVHEGLDYLSLSLAGVDEKNDSIRRGTSLKQVRWAVEEVKRARTEAGRDYPRIHLAYMLLKTGLEDIPLMAEFFSSLGVDQVVVSSLTLAYTRAMQREMLLADSEEEFNSLRTRLAEMRENCPNPEAVHFHIYNPWLSPGFCSENIFRALYTDVDGHVRPCVCTDFSDSKLWKASTVEGRFPPGVLDFGNVREKGLNLIWRSREYAGFRRAWVRGDIPEICLGCTKPFIDQLSA